MENITKYLKKENITNEYLISKVLKLVLCKMAINDIEELSLKHEDIAEYGEELDKIFKSINITSEILSKTPVSKTYDHLKLFLIRLTMRRFMGFFNTNNDTIYLTIDKVVEKRVLDQNNELEELIDKCFKAINSKNIKLLIMEK